MENKSEDVLKMGSPRRWHLSYWPAVLYIGTMAPLVHAGIPYLVASYSARRGWVDGHLSVWNALGLVLVAAGAAGIAWCVRLHFAVAGRSFEFTRTPKYLLTNGPYGFSRNPIYLSAAVIWLGWAIFYGSVTLLAAICILAMSIGQIIVRVEERGLEARFGESYLAYKRTVLRWIELSTDISANVG
jgi:protein-S-isoprenylcysteine O-methyltransferase Ste14